MQLQFGTQFECYQAIGSLIASAIEEPWDDARVDAELDGIEITLIKTYLPKGGGKRRDIPFIPTLGECFYRLARLVSSEDKGLFKKCTFTLHSDGKYSTDFVY
jgi:hypothetical protein